MNKWQIITIIISTDIDKAGNVLKIKAIPVQAWTGPEDSRRLRLPEVVGKQHMKVVSLQTFLLLLNGSEDSAGIDYGIFELPSYV